MKVLDLFAGLGGWSQPFRDRGHEVFTVDYDKKFDVDLHMDINELHLHPYLIPWEPDIILASPPCEKFSVMTIGRNWNKDGTPKNDAAREALELVDVTMDLIQIYLTPKYWVLENPRGKLRSLISDLDYWERRTVTYCQYGLSYMKPTDLWGGFPPSLELKPMCKPRAACHTNAPRGSKTGVQANHRDDLPDSAREWLNSLPPRKSNTFRGGFIEDMARFPSWSEERKTLSALRAKIPYQLALDVCLAAEKDIG